MKRVLHRLPLTGLVTIVVLLVLWQVLYAVVGDVALRSPWQTIGTTLAFMSTGLFYANAFETLKAFGAALGLSIAIGLSIGFSLGLSRFMREVFEPSLIALYSVPKITLYPIVLLSFGLGMPSKIAFGTIHGVVPIALFTINAVRNVRPVLIKTGRVLKLSRLEMVRVVLFPAALPEIFSGLRIGFSLTLVGTLLGEMFASQAGLGYLLMNAIGLDNVDRIMSVTLLIVVFAAGVSAVLLSIDRRLHQRA